jgi:hypothetical protein
MESTTALKLGVVIVLAGFLPLAGVSYYRFRLPQRRVEIERIFDELGMTGARYRAVYAVTGWHLALAVAFATLVSLLGLSTLFIGEESGLTRQASLFLAAPHPGWFQSSTSRPGAATGQQDTAGAQPSATTQPDRPASVTADRSSQFASYQAGALMVFGMASLGAYLWGLQHIFRRYAVGDLSPGTYHNLGLRMIFAAVVAVMLYHGGAVMFSDISSSDLPSVWPALAFLLGMFPQQGVQWLTKRFSVFSSQTPSAQERPLELIQGFEAHDRMRMEELGVDSCYDLAVADFIPLIIRTPYSARQIVDWILQAKLCVYCGDAVADLRRQGFRTILDLAGLDREAIAQLARETQLTESALARASAAATGNEELNRLRECELLLGRYWHRESAASSPSGRGTAEAA